MNRTSNLIQGGLIPVLPTPFDESGAVDLEGIERVVDLQLEACVDAVALFGFASESFSLTDEERDQILARVRAQVVRDLPLVVGISATGGRAAARQVEIAAEAGADMVMVLPPHLVKADADGLIAYYTEVAGIGLPVMIQDAPAVTGVSVGAGLLRALAEIEGVVAVKVESPPTPRHVEEAVAATDGALAVFGGQNALFVLEEYDRGAIGTMPACEFSDVIRRILDLRARGLDQEARALFNRALPLIRYGLQPGLAWAIHKEVLRIGGVIDTCVVRPPALALDERTARDLEIILADLDDVGLAALRTGRS